MVIFSRTNILFFAFLFFSIMLPMDIPQLLYPHNQSKKTLKDIPISWSDMDKKKQQFGDYFALLPKEIIYPYFLIQSDPSVKNGLRVNKAFSALLSWEEMQPFMLHKELCASQDDLKRIIIENIYLYRKITNNPMPLANQSFIQDMKKKLITLSYPIIGCINNRTERFDLDLALSDSSKSVLLISDRKGLIINSQYIDTTISPLLIACIARKPYIVKNCLKSISLHSISDDNFERALHIVVQNDDERSLELLLDDKSKERITFSLSSKLSQLALLCGSSRVMSVIGNLYRVKNTRMVISNSMQEEEKDFIVSWLNLIDEEEGHTLHSITKKHHKALSQKNANNQKGYHKCLNVLFEKTKLMKFDPPVEIMDIKNGYNKSDGKNRKECIIS